MSTIVTICTPSAIVTATDSRASVGRFQGSDQQGLRFHVDGFRRSWSGLHAAVSFVSADQPSAFWETVEEALSGADDEPADVVLESTAALLEGFPGVKGVVSGYTREREPRVWNVGGGTLLVAEGPSVSVRSYEELVQRVFQDVLVPSQNLPIGHPDLHYTHLPRWIDPATLSEQEAVELARWIVESTGFLEKLRKRGPFPGVGGPTRIIVITQDGKHAVDMEAEHLWTRHN